MAAEVYMVSTWEERWERRQASRPATPSVEPPAAAAGGPTAWVSREVAGSFRLAAHLRASPILTLALGALALGVQAGVGVGLLSASGVLFLYYLIRWLERVLTLLASMTARSHDLKGLQS